MARTTNNQPRTSSRAMAKSLATQRPKLRDNTERVSNTWEGETIKRNTPLKDTTCTTVPGGALQVDDVMEIGVKYRTPDVFQCTYDQTGRIPAWNKMSENINAPDAVTRTTMEGQLIEGYHKGANVIKFDEKANALISSGGVLDARTKLPTLPNTGNRV
jgi:hypothetical protein